MKAWEFILIEHNMLRYGNWGSGYAFAYSTVYRVSNMYNTEAKSYISKGVLNCYNNSRATLGVF